MRPSDFGRADFLGGHGIPPGSARSSLFGPGQSEQGLESSISRAGGGGCIRIFDLDPAFRRSRAIGTMTLSAFHIMDTGPHMLRNQPRLDLIRARAGQDVAEGVRDV
jgi:hypothetical protein